MCFSACDFFFFFVNDTATPEIYTLSLHDALPILGARGTQDHRPVGPRHVGRARVGRPRQQLELMHRDRKSTRLNSSHITISYAVFCLKKKKKKTNNTIKKKKSIKKQHHTTR